jgi:hypothetical protein
MKIYFKKVGDKFVNVQTSSELPIGLISTYEHWFDKDKEGKEGWVEVPVSLIINGEVKVVGIKSETKLVDSEGKQINTLPYVQFPEIHNPPFHVLTQEERDKVYKTLMEKVQLKEEETDELFPSSATVKEIWDIYDGMGVQFVNSKEQTLKNLGFVPRPNPDGSVHRWYHPLFGSDAPENWLLFDPATDDLTSLIQKTFRSGMVQGARKVRRDIKAALDI